MSLARRFCWSIFYGACLALLFTPWTRSQQIEMDMLSYTADPAPPRDPKMRFTPEHCEMTTAYPSDGGIVIGELTAVELKHLNISRFQSNFRSQDAAQEDKFAFELMQLGAHWFTDWRTFWRHRNAVYKTMVTYDFHYPPIIHTAYPTTGGAWILKHSADRGYWSSNFSIGRQPSLPEEPEHLRGALSLCLNMDERSLVLERFGGRFFRDASDCDDIPASLQAGIQAGQHYALLSQKMEDADYRNQWLDEWS